MRSRCARQKQRRSKRAACLRWFQFGGGRLADPLTAQRQWVEGCRGQGRAGDGIGEEGRGGEVDGGGGAEYGRGKDMRAYTMRSRRRLSPPYVDCNGGIPREFYALCYQ